MAVGVSGPAPVINRAPRPWVAKLNDQVRRLDANIYAPPLAPDKPQGSNPVVRQLGLLKAAFEQDGH